MRSLYLVRHAVALERDSWPGPDRLRPLSEAGWRQAVALADLLADARIEAHHTSPARRCWDTLIPLAHAQGMEPVDDTRLLEGDAAPGRAAAAAELQGLIRTYFAGGVRRCAACSHGDLIPPLLEAAGAAPGSRSPKGGVWRLDLPDDRDQISQAVYLGRPAAGGGWEQR